MTERKPFDVPVESWVDAQIRAAQERGAFTNLKGAGKPLPKRDASDPDWWLKQKVVEENLELPLPPTLGLKKEVRSKLAAIRLFTDERKVREALALLNEQIRKANRTAIHGPPTDMAPVNVERFVDAWREG